MTSPTSPPPSRSSSASLNGDVESWPVFCLTSPPPDYSSPDKEPFRGQSDSHPLASLIPSAEYLQLTNTLAGEEEEQDFENGFFFPQPPSPNLLTEAPTPEFIGKKIYSNKNK